MRIIAAAALLVAAAPAAAQPVDPAPVDAIFARYSGRQTPGCAVGVARGAETIVRRAYGSADLEHDVALTPESILEAGSVSKQFTAAAVLLLVEDGRLRLTDDVRRYVPELPDYGVPITIDHLLSHTSGLRDWGTVMNFAGWPRGTRHYTMDDVLAVITRQRALNYAPGAEYSYTNSGYNLLAIIVQRVSGQSLADFTRARMFEPLGMRSTSWRDDYRRVVPGRAIAYQPAGESGFVQAMPFEDGYGNGGLLTNVQDLLTWNEALTAGRLGAQVTQRLTERARLNDGRQIEYARGIVVQTHRGQPEISHNGATGGYRAYLGRFPDSRLSVALLCNAANADPDMAYDVAHLYMAPAAPAVPGAVAPAPAPAAPAPAPAAPAEASLAGTFVSAKDGTALRLAVEAGALRLVNGPQLQSTGPRRFQLGEAELRFTDADRMILKLPDGEEVRYARARPFVPSPAELAAYAGRYASGEANAAYLVRVENGTLVAQLEERPQVKVPLRPVYADAFDANGAIVRFRRNARGGIASMGLGQGRVRDLPFVRTGDVPAAAPQAAVPAR